MRRIWFCLLLAACGDGNASGALFDASTNPIGPRDDAAIDPDDAAPADAARSDAGPDASRPPPARADAAVPSTELGPDYREQGALAVAVKTAKFAGDTCSFNYESFTPASAKTEMQVVLAPGFALFPNLGSSREAMRTLATHIASWGVTTYTVDLCTNGVSIDHSKNGAAIAEFGGEVGGKRVLYAGFSAGGLDALIAAAKAPNTDAFLALDAVDTGDLAKPALDALKKPIYAMVGEPSQCNSEENMLVQYKGRTLRVVKVNKAQHFTFEGAPCQGPKCGLCEGGGEPEATAVRALAASYVVGIGGIDSNALSWWETGSLGFEALSADGVVSIEQ